MTRRALAGALRALGLACALLAGACDQPGPHAEEDVVYEDPDAAPSVTYAEMRLTPRGPSSGLAEDLERLREASLADPYTFEDAPENIDLGRRARLRTFEGAPPAIPHAVRQGSASECLTCHGERVAIRGRQARPISHAERTDCTGCHLTQDASVPAAELDPDPRALANTFVGTRRQVATPDATAVPPRIPHRPAMRERCTACHGANGPAAGHHPVDFVPDRPLPEGFLLSEEGHLTCRTCHTLDPRVATFTDDEAAAKVATPQGSDLCLACHEASHEPVFARLGLSGGAHPGGKDLDRELSARMQRDTSRSGCLGCHGTDGALQRGSLREAGEGRVCAVCHPTQAWPERNHPVGSPTQPGKQLPADLPTGPDGAPICRSCHDLVAGKRDRLVRAMQGSASLCMSCHTDRVDAMAGKHGEPGETLGEPCFACHEVHGTSRADHLLAVTARATGADPTGCLSCHGPGRSAARAEVRPGSWGHPVDGRRHAGMAEPLTCLACHDPHEPDPSQIDCTSCHPEQGAGFDRGGHGDADCLDCHPAHGSAPFAAVAGENPAAQRCLGCHDAELGRRGLAHVSEYAHPAPVFTPGGERWEPLSALPLYGPDGRPVASGINGDLTCSTCHTTHGPDADHPGDHLRRPGWQGVCAACHGGQSLFVYRYFHDRGKIEEIAP